MTQLRVYTVGHSNHSLETFLSLLRRHQVTAVADVRSRPQSSFVPHFNRGPLRQSLRDAEIGYAFLGKELGARPSDRGCYRGGRVSYELLGKSQLFQAGIDRVMSGSEGQLVALMCTERDPLDCHRTILVARVLAARGVRVDHIHGSGVVESHDAAMTRLLELSHMPPNLFASDTQQVDVALAQKEAEIAYVDPAVPAGAGLSR